MLSPLESGSSPRVGGAGGTVVPASSGGTTAGTEACPLPAPLRGVAAEDYLISRSSCADPYESEAWLLTAKTLFPTSFSVQFAIYAMYKEGQRYAEAANQLTDMMVSFGREPALWPEMRLVATAASAGVPPQESASVDGATQPATAAPAVVDSPSTSAIFAKLTPQSQYALLLAVCGRATDVADRCRCTIMLLRQFPDSITEHGAPLIEELLAAQRGGGAQIASVTSAQLRKLLVCDVLPLVLPRLQLPAPLVIELLDHAIVFYVRSMRSVNAPHAKTKPPPPPPPLAAAAATSASVPEEPKELWARLFELTRLVASKLKWTLGDLLATSSGLSEHQLTRLKAEALLSHIGDVVDLSKSRSSASKLGPDDRTQKFYVTLVLFLQSLYFYGRYTSASAESGVDGAVTPGVVLVDFREPVVQPPKKKKFEKPPGHLSASRQLPSDVAQSLITHFQIAVRCWSTLATSYKSEFERMSGAIGLAELWATFLNSFFIDAAVYQHHLDEALQLGCKLLGELATSADWTARVKANLQMASCLFATGDRETAFTRLTETLTLLASRSPAAAAAAVRPEVGDTDRRNSDGGLAPNLALGSDAGQPLSQQQQQQQQQQQLCFVVCSRNEVLRFFVRILMTVLKERLATDQRDDFALGCLVVLCQAEWPAHEAQLQQLIATIRRAKVFSYPLFMTYVVVPDILEEFAYLASDQQQELQLDLLPAAQGTGARSRTVTRGVNKGAKEELRAAMEKQMSRANEDVTQLIVNFLLNERHVLSPKR